MSMYSLFIENPKNSKIGDTVEFDNREDMDKYIELEKQYCKNQLISLYKAISVKERDLAKKNLVEARFTFLSDVIRAMENNNEKG